MGEGRDRAGLALEAGQPLGIPGQLFRHDLDGELQEPSQASRIPLNCHRACGGSVAHVFQARGFNCLNVANGTEAAHQPDERVSVEALGTMLDVALGIVARSAS